MSWCFYALGAILCWASLPAATGSGLQELSTEELMFYSFTSAAIYLYVQDIVIKKRFKVVFPGFSGCCLGLWGIFLYHYIYYLALARAPLAEGAILATTWSLWIVIFSSILLFRRLKFSILAIALIGFCGAVMVMSSGERLAFEARHLTGYLLALSCGLIWASFSVGLPLLKLRHEPMTAFTIIAAICSAGLFVLTLPHDFPSCRALLSAIYLGCVPLGLSFFLWNRAITDGNLVIIGLLSYLTPPLAVLLVALVHGQAVSNQVLIGMAIIIGASIMGRIALKRNSKKRIAGKYQ